MHLLVRADVKRIVLLPSSAACLKVLAPAFLSGHSFRRSGCKLLARTGSPTAGIQWQGRWSQRQSLVTLRRLQKKPRFTHGHGHLGQCQVADGRYAARKTGQLEASVQEVAKQVEGVSGRLGGLADVLDEISGKIRPTNCLHVAGPSRQYRRRRCASGVPRELIGFSEVPTAAECSQTQHFRIFTVIKKEWRAAMVQAAAVEPPPTQLPAGGAPPMYGYRRGTQTSGRLSVSKWSKS